MNNSKTSTENKSVNQNENITLNIDLPLFTGYYSNPLYDVQRVEDDVIEYLEIENDILLTGEDIDKIEFKYKDYYNSISKNLCKSVENLLFDLNIVTDIKFVKLVSPKYYNYTNDRIVVDINFNTETYNTILDYLKENKEAFKEYLKDNYSSYDGFISFLSNDYEVWMHEYLKVGNEDIETCLSGVLDFILKENEYNEMSLLDDDCIQSINYIEYSIDGDIEGLSRTEG